MDDITGWLAGRLPDEWFEGPPQVSVDRDEILVVGVLPEPTAGPEEPGRRAAEAGRIKRFREETRSRRMRIADEAEQRFGRKVAWGASCGQTREVFTSLSVPVMTRLRQPERMVLDTLVEAGVARSRSEALAWSVRLVGQHQREWIDQLREALVAVEAARAAGPVT
ncbi:hypothetical protein GMA12_11090 [Kocuria sediminis]|uniref:Uncharacterized protein n=1 Tax=Kocuria sediminis TaxID=1038857 RepID=A0A6N8GNC8_9MICC|nr:hypothetical protein [Kocuria sediminis]MUN63682.1 hypothetical protein [Kocuria sediminis]